MSRFVLNPTPEARSAPGAISALSQTLDALAQPGAGPVRSVLLVLDPGLEAAGMIAKVEAAAAGDGRAVHSAVPPPGEPTEAFIRETIAFAQAQQVDAVIAVGGGSAIDAGKVVACLAAGGEDVARYRLAAEPMPPRRAALVAAPTTAGTGAEATTTAILADEAGVKQWFWDPGLRPDRVLLDPELTVGLPPAATAATGFDALVHAVEAATNKNAFRANDVYALHAVRLVSETLARAVDEPTDVSARSDMQEAAYFAGLAIDNAGTGVAHAIGHALGSLCGIGHGRAVAIGLCASLDWSIEGHEAAYLGVAEAVGVGEARDLPGALRGLAEEVGLDLGLGEAGRALTVEALARQIGQPENAAMLTASRRPVEPKDVTHFAERALALGGA